jgi:hypothetical protein
MSRFPPQAFRLAIANSHAMARRLAAIEAAMLRQGKPARVIPPPDPMKNQNLAEVRPCLRCGEFFFGRQDYCYRCRWKLGIYRNKPSSPLP